MWRRGSNPTPGDERGGSAAVPSPSLEALTASLGTRDPNARAIAWRRLLATDDPRVIPLAHEALREQEVPVVIAAIECLARHRCREAVPLLTELLSQPDHFSRFGPESESVRSRAAWALGHLGEPAAAPALCDAVGQGWQLTQAAYDALIALGPRATDALSGLLEETPEEVHLAISVLTQFGAPAAPCLREVIRNGNPVIRRRCATLLASCGSGTTDLIPELLLGLEDPVEIIRTRAAEGLAQMAEVRPDPRLRQAVPRLRKLASFWQLRPGADPRPYAAALRQIETALRHLHHLPLPTAAPGDAGQALPRPAENPPLEGPFPIPAPPDTK